MAARLLIHTVFLVASLALVFFWTKTPFLAQYSPQLTAFLGLLYFVNRYFGKKSLSLAVNGFIFTSVTTLLVSETGGLTSPLFFLFYLLIFGLSLLFEPIITVIFITLLAFYFSDQVQNLNAFLQLAGLLLVTPIALYFGKQYLTILEEERKIKILSKEREFLVKEVIQQEEDTLLWLVLSFREQVIQILDSSSNLLANLSHLTVSQKEGLQKIHESARKLLRLGSRLREKIEV